MTKMTKIYMWERKAAVVVVGILFIVLYALLNYIFRWCLKKIYKEWEKEENTFLYIYTSLLLFSNKKKWTTIGDVKQKEKCIYAKNSVEQFHGVMWFVCIHEAFIVKILKTQDISKLNCKWTHIISFSHHTNIIRPK